MIRLTEIWLLVVVVGCLVVGSSEAKVSETCEKESKLVYSYTSLQEELHLLLHTNVGGQVQDCDYKTPTDFFCHIEYQPSGPVNKKTLDDYYGLCQRANGKIIHRSITMGNNLLDEYLSFTFTMTGIPQCVGLSCDPNTIEQEDLQNKIFADFLAEMQVGDICDPDSNITWGKLKKKSGSDFGVQLASWAGMDFRDCFDRPSSSDEDEEEDAVVDDAGSGSSTSVSSTEEATADGTKSMDSPEEEEDDGGDGRKLLRATRAETHYHVGAS